MKNKKGFTLLELLAVIIILAVIALIATPIVLNVVDEAKKSAFQDSAYGLIKSGEYYYTSQILNGGMTSDKVFNFPNNTELEFSGAEPKSGYIKVTKEGLVEIAVSDGKYCATKGINDSEIIVSENLEICGFTSETSFTWITTDVENRLMIELDDSTTLIKISDLSPSNLEGAKLSIVNNETSEVEELILKVDDGYLLKLTDELIICYPFFYVVLVDNYTIEGFTFEEAGVYTNLDFSMENYTVILDWTDGEKIPLITPEAPYEVIAAETNDDSVILSIIDGAEYSIDGENWQDSPEFNDLTVGVEYIFYARYKATEVSNASYVTTAKIRTGLALTYENLDKVGYTDETVNLVIPEKVQGEDGKFRTVTSIDTFAFSSYNLTSVTIPSGVTYIGVDAFRDCENLQEFLVAASNTQYQAINGVLYSKDMKVLVRYPSDKKDSSYFILNGVEIIGDGAFWRCDNLTNVTIPDGVIILNQGAFRESSNLVSITIPSSVTTIGSSAFSGCYNLETIEFEENSELTTLEWGAFFGCSSLDNVLLPDSLTTIAGAAFYNCSSLTSITIPKNVTTLGESSIFYQCYSLKEIIVDHNNQTYASKDGVLYSKNLSVLICYPAGKIGDSFSVPGSVTTIAQGAFYNCGNLANVEIPNSVTVIGNEAFRYCGKLTNVVLPDSLTLIDSETFRDCSSLTSITIPKTVTSIGLWAIMDCSKLTSIIYEGTVQQWNNEIEKNSSWNSDTKEITVTCIDGTVVVPARPY